MNRPREIEKHFELRYTTAMENCIFCKIIAKQIPAEIVYEDETFMAFLSIDPLSPGHTLVVPKKHFRWVWDVTNAGDYFEVVVKIAHAQQKAFGTEAIHSKIIGEEVHHAHIWVFPDPATTKGNKKDFVNNADKIRKEISKAFLNGAQTS